MRVRASYRVNTRQLNRLAQMPALFTAFANRAKAVISQDINTRFETSTDPQGNPWQPLAPSTLRQSVRQAIAKVGGRAARPVVQRTPSGVLIARARNPLHGYQRTARVRRTRQSKILIDTGRLRASVVSLAGRGDAVRITDNQRLRIVWGTRVPYAAQHQYGAGRIPKRPFLPLSRNALNRLRQILAQEVRRR